MDLIDTQTRFAARRIDALYTEALLLADESRAYFDRRDVPERDALAPLPRITVSCEALKISTRLMHVTAWLLARRAATAAERRDEARTVTPRGLGHVAESDPAALEGVPPGAFRLIEASCELYQRVRRLDGGGQEPEQASPALGLIRQLERTF